MSASRRARPRPHGRGRARARRARHRLGRGHRSSRCASGRPTSTRASRSSPMRALSARHFLAAAPDRLVIDVDGLELSPQLRELVGKVRADDPFIAGVRVGQSQPRVVRLVIDLKQPTAPRAVHARAGRRLPVPAGLRPPSDPGARSAARADPRPRAGRAEGRAVGAGRARRVHRPGRRGAASRPRRRFSASAPIVARHAPLGAPPPGLRRARSSPARAAAGRAGQDRSPRRRRGRPRPRRRGSGRDRAERPAREGRRAADRDAAARPAQRQPEHARDDDPRRRLLRAAARARQEGAARPGRSLRVDPRRRLPHARGARRVGVRAQPGRRDEQRGALDGEQARTRPTSSAAPA